MPELAFDETRTSAYLQRELKALDIPFRAGVAGTGIIATLGSGSPRVALRSDIDALPIKVRHCASWSVFNPCQVSSQIQSLRKLSRTSSSVVISNQTPCHLASIFSLSLAYQTCRHGNQML